MSRTLLAAFLPKNSPAERSLPRRMFPKFAIGWLAGPALCGLLSLLPLWAQQPRPAAPDAQPQEQEPPEEDQSFKPKVYDFNPLKAKSSIDAGNYYFKKGSFAAAKGRYKDATLYDPGSAEAFEKLGEVSEKMHDFTTARDSYAKYLELAPAAKDAEAVKKRMEKLPGLPQSSPKK